MVISNSISKPNNKFARKFNKESWKTEVRRPKYFSSAVFRLLTSVKFLKYET